MKKSNSIIRKLSFDHIKWTDDKIYLEIKKILNSKYENAKLETVYYEIPCPVSVHGTFTFQDKIMNTLNRVNYEVFMHVLKIDWENPEKLELKLIRTEPKRGN